MKNRISQSRRAIFVCAIALAAAASPRAAAGEVFVLKSGGRVEGEYLNADRSSGQPYLLKTGEGVRVALPEAGVQRVIVKTDLDKQYEALLPKVENTAAGQWAMSEWCREAGLLDQRKRHLAAVIALEPNHAEARKALGYQLFGSRWLTQDEYMQSQGYQRYKGAWRLKQEVEIESRTRQNELAAKQWRRDIRRWFEQYLSGSRHAETASRELAKINDPQAATALIEILADSKEPQAVRKECLKMLARLPPGLAEVTHVRLAMEDADDQIRDGCLDELIRQGTHSVLPKFVAELKSKDNRRVNRAAECLQRLGDKEATLPLIDALKTEHRFAIQQGAGPPGSMSLGFGGGTSGTGSGGGGGLGGMSMGGKPKIIKQMMENSSVRAALTSLNPGVNYQYDENAWREWYIQSQNTSTVDFRRGE
jgi:hypothetical protein